MSLPAAKAVHLSSHTVHEIFQVLQERWSLVPRDSQLSLASQVERTLTSKGICCIEAPTGTGKTLGYLAGALAAQAKSADPLPVVVATATVGLQEQIIRFDIPRLAEAGLLDPARVAVAKGRGRYFCPRTAAMLEDKQMQDTQFDMFQPDKKVADAGVPIALDMLHSWKAKTWDGDKDSWKGAIPGCWDSSCGASSETCVTRACEHFETCPYMESRSKLSKASLIVANQDIVLADLAQRAAEQSASALPLKAYSLIVDEAHNLPEKALTTKRFKAKTYETDWLRKLESYGERAYATPAIAAALGRSTSFGVTTFSTEAAQLLAGLERMGVKLSETLQFNAAGQCSWGLHRVPEAVLADLQPLLGWAFGIQEALKACIKAYAGQAEESVGAEKGYSVRQLAEAHKLSSSAQELYTGLANFVSHEALVRWVYRRKDGGIALHSQPLEGSHVLSEILWKQQIPVALVSATLQINGSFERFRAKSGLPAGAVTEALAPVFDYSRGFLHQPEMRCSPVDAGFNAEVTNALERLWDCKLQGGMLVLFTSKDAMTRVADALRPEIRDCTLVQHEKPLPEILAQHRERIDAGRRSVLFGLDSMAEGLDLPGKYCAHVVVTRLPFAVPSDPVETARQEQLGPKWFKEAYLADMLTMLIQASGRLIRREDDHGLITLLDNRLQTKTYGTYALDALPQFTRVQKIKQYLELSKARGFDMCHGQGPVLEKAKLTLVPQSEHPTPIEPVAVEPQPSAGSATHSEKVSLLLAAARKPFALGPDVSRVDELPGMLALAMPVQESAGDVPLLDAQEPCLPPTSPRRTWAEKQMPQAVLLGLDLLNGGWEPNAPRWEQALRLRPDLIQCVEILRLHEYELLDDRNGLISAQTCKDLLHKCLFSLGAPDDVQAILAVLNQVERRVGLLLRGSYRVPTKDFLLSMSACGVGLSTGP